LIKTVNIGNLKIANSTYGAYIDYFDKIIEKKNPENIISYVNTYVFLKYLKDKSIQNCLDSFLLIPDGIGMHLALKYFFGPLISTEKIVSTDLWDILLLYLSKNKRRVFFYGGWEISYDNLKEKILGSYPGLSIAGFFDGANKLKENDLKQIYESKADVLFVGLGTPLQEKWILENKNNLNIPLIIACGSAIDFFSGYTKRAPMYLRKMHLEWLHRLLLNPGRLWKRYIIGIPVFVFKVIIIKIKFEGKSKQR